MNKLRIGIFTDTYPPYINGVSTSIAMLESALKKEGHEVFIVTVNTTEYKFEETDHIIRIPGIPIGIYDYRLTGIYPLKAINKIKKWNLDIIHSHTEFGVGTFARIIAKQLDIPLVHTYHTMYEDYVHYVTKGYFNRSSKKLVEYLTKFYCDRTATALIVPTEKTYRLFKDKYHTSNNPNIIPTGIEVEKFYKENFKIEQTVDLRKSLGIAKDDFVIMFVGRLGDEKSIDVLIDGHISIVKKHPNTKLIIIGDGPDADKFKRRVSKHKLENSVIFTGKVPWDKIPDYYQTANLFATASRTETQGLTVIEAMAASVPVVCADDEAFLTVVKDGINGKIFKNRRDYKNKVIELIEDEKLLKNMETEARIEADKHSAKQFAHDVLKVYYSVVYPKDNNKTFVGKLKNVVKKGIYGK